MRQQRGICYWCEFGFEQDVFRLGMLVRRKVNFDHWIPVSFSGDIHACNIVASCSICNSLKSNLLFANEYECRKYIRIQWRAKKFTIERPGIFLSEVREAVR